MTIEMAVQELRMGGLVAFPTETVYGLGADASNPASLDKLYSLKGRPRNHPVIVHLGCRSWLPKWTETCEAAEKLADAFWPGPLTLILERRPGVSDQLTGGQNTVGVRMPSHPIALELLIEFGGGLAAPSANRFGRISPTTADHVRQEFGDRVQVLDGGPCKVGVESTIIDLSGGAPVLLRPGHITPEDVFEVLGKKVRVGEGAVRAPGTLDSHYCPETPAFLVDGEKLDKALEQAKTRGLKVAVLCHQQLTSETYWVQAPEDALEYARELYANLRLLDQAGADEILIEEPPAKESWLAISDRLARATTGFKRLDCPR